MLLLSNQTLVGFQFQSYLWATILDAMTHWTRLFPVYSQKLSFEASQIPQKFLQLPLMVYCSAVNTPFLVHPGNYVECQELTVDRFYTPGSQVIFRSFEHVSVSRKQRIGGSNCSAKYFKYLSTVSFNSAIDRVSRSF